MKSELTFWEHLDELRSVIIRILAVVFVALIVAFCFKDVMFAVLLAPQHPDFVTYRWMDGFMPGSLQHIQLINTELAQQFLIHIKAAACVGVIAVSPYVLYECFRFISPALYQNEWRCAVWIVVGSYVMFMLGMLFSYFVIFPFTFRFLGTYQVDPDVVNTITLESYMSTLLAITLMLGLVFQMPVLSWILGRVGLIDRSMMRRCRRHVIVGILVAAAIITPTSDAFTLLLVSVPMYLLYELSIFLVKKK